MKKLLSNLDVKILDTFQLSKLKGGSDEKTDDIIIEDIING